MGDNSGERLTRAFATAAKLFAGSPSLPNFPVPSEFEVEWNTFSIGTVMGEVWTRPGLDIRDRSMVTIALLAASHKPEQLRQYVGVGLNQGLTREQVCEVLLHTAIYAGFPSAVEGFRIAKEVFDEYDRAAEAARETAPGPEPSKEG